MWQGMQNSSHDIQIWRHLLKRGIYEKGPAFYIQKLELSSTMRKASCLFATLWLQ